MRKTMMGHFRSQWTSRQPNNITKEHKWCFTHISAESALCSQLYLLIVWFLQEVEWAEWLNSSVIYCMLLMRSTWHYWEISNSHSLEIPTDRFFSHLDCGIFPFIDAHSPCFYFWLSWFVKKEHRCRKVWELWAKKHAFRMMRCLLSATGKLGQREQDWKSQHTKRSADFSLFLCGIWPNFLNVI